MNVPSFCVEKAVILKNNDTFYYDARTGEKIDAFTQSYWTLQNAVTRNCDPVQYIQSCNRVGDTIIVRLISGNSVHVTMINYEPETQKFKVFCYDPSIIIPYILNDGEVAAYLKEKGHFYYTKKSNIVHDSVIYNLDEDGGCDSCSECSQRAITNEEIEEMEKMFGASPVGSVAGSDVAGSTADSTAASDIEVIFTTDTDADSASDSSEEPDLPFSIIKHKRNNMLNSYLNINPLPRTDVKTNSDTNSDTSRDSDNDELVLPGTRLHHPAVMIPNYGHLHRMNMRHLEEPVEDNIDSIQDCQLRREQALRRMTLFNMRNQQHELRMEQLNKLREQHELRMHQLKQHQEIIDSIGTLEDIDTTVIPKLAARENNLFQEKKTAEEIKSMIVNDTDVNGREVTDTAEEIKSMFVNDTLTNPRTNPLTNPRTSVLTNPRTNPISYTYNTNYYNTPLSTLNTNISPRLQPPILCRQRNGVVVSKATTLHNLNKFLEFNRKFTSMLNTYNAELELIDAIEVQDISQEDSEQLFQTIQKMKIAITTLLHKLNKVSNSTIKHMPEA